MRLFALMLVIATLGGCAPLVIGGVAGYELEKHYGNCNKHWQCYGAACGCKMPMGVHR